MENLQDAMNVLEHLRQETENATSVAQLAQLLNEAEAAIETLANEGDERELADYAPMGDLPIFGGVNLTDHLGDGYFSWSPEHALVQKNEWEAIPNPLKGWTPTHEVETIGRRYQVMLDDEGRAYTAGEWACTDQADLEFHPQRGWLFQGSCFSGEVRPL